VVVEARRAQIRQLAALETRAHQRELVCVKRLAGARSVVVQAKPTFNVRGALTCAVLAIFSLR
jgi:hypothetical protein